MARSGLPGIPGRLNGLASARMRRRIRRVPPYGGTLKCSVSPPHALPFPMTASVDFTISFESSDEDGWIVARVLEIPGTVSQGRTREEARENSLDAFGTVLDAG